MIYTLDIIIVIVLGAFALLIIAFLLLNYLSSGRAGVKAGADLKRIIFDVEDAQSHIGYEMKGRVVDVTDTSYSDYILSQAIESLQSKTQDVRAIEKLKYVQQSMTTFRGQGEFQYRVLVFRAKLTIIMWTKKGRPIESYIRAHRKRGFRIESLGSQREIQGIIQRIKLPKGLRPLPGMRRQNEVAFLLPIEHVIDKEAMKTIDVFTRETATMLAVMPLVSESQNELKLEKKRRKDIETENKRLQGELTRAASYKFSDSRTHSLLKKYLFPDSQKIINNIPSLFSLGIPFVLFIVLEYTEYGHIDPIGLTAVSVGLMFVALISVSMRH